MEKLPIQVKTKAIKSFYLSCPAMKASLQLENCIECKYHGGIMSKEFVQYNDGKVAEIPPDAKTTNSGAVRDAESGKASRVSIPTQIVCNYPTVIGLGYIWETK